MSTSDPHAPYGRHHVVPLAVSLAGVYASPARPVHAGVYALPTKPAFCRYRQGKLVINIG